MVLFLNEIYINWLKFIYNQLFAKILQKGCFGTDILVLVKVSPKVFFRGMQPMLVPSPMWEKFCNNHIYLQCKYPSNFVFLVKQT